MKICLLANPKSIFIKNWSEFYSKGNNEVHIIYLDRILAPINKISTPGVFFHRIRLFSFTLLNLQSFYNYLQLRRLLYKIKPDILHVHYISYHAWLAALSGFHPLVVSAYGSDIYIEAEESMRHRNWVKYVFKTADLITTTSKTLRKYIIEKYKVNKNKIVNFYWGLNLKLFKKNYNNEVKKLRRKYNLGKETFVILSSRHMKPLYGIHYIIESIPEVVNKRKNVKFILLRGSSVKEYEQQLRDQIKDLNIENFVIFISEYLSPKDMAVYNNLADIIISTPISDQFSEAILEGMACGAIPIVNNLDVYTEHLEDGKNGFFVDREKPKDIAKKIIYCIDNHTKLKEKFAKINRKILEEENDWDKNSKIMIQHYNKLIKKDL